MLSPYDERITVEGGRLTLENRTQNRKKTISVSGAPGLAALVESIRATRAGDLAALQRHYALQLEGSREHWTLTLKPLDARSRDYVTSLALSGSETPHRPDHGRGGGRRPVGDGDQRRAEGTGPFRQATRSLPVPRTPRVDAPTVKDRHRARRSSPGSCSSRSASDGSTAISPSAPISPYSCRRPPIPSQRLLVSQLRDGVVARLILIALEGEEPAALAQASRELARRLQGERAVRGREQRRSRGAPRKSASCSSSTAIC